jgi:hypothetical protein
MNNALQVHDVRSVSKPTITNPYRANPIAARLAGIQNPATK